MPNRGDFRVVFDPLALDGAGPARPPTEGAERFQVVGYLRRVTPIE